MRCREFTDFMADYLSDELPSGARQQFEWHLELCVNCQRYLASYRGTIVLARGAFADDDAPLPMDVPDQLAQAILTARTSR